MPGKASGATMSISANRRISGALGTYPIKSFAIVRSKSDFPKNATVAKDFSAPQNKPRERSETARAHRTNLLISRRNNRQTLDCYEDLIG